MTVEKIVVYTAVAGCYDDIQDPEYITPGIDYVCFTDNPYIQSKVWEIRPLPIFLNDTVRQAKIPKILPHRFFPEHQVSLWLDGNLLIRSNLRPFVESVTQGGLNLALFRHPENRSSMMSEVQACIELRKDDPKKLSAQLKTYLKAGVPVDHPVPACMAIARRHNVPEIVAAMEDWWKHIVQYSRRDQISFTYVRYKHGLTHCIIDGDVRNNIYWTWRPHRLNILAEQMKLSYINSDVSFVSFPKSGRTWIRHQMASYLKHHSGIPFSLDFPPRTGIPSIAFKHDYAQLYQDCPGEPSIVYPEILSEKKLVVMVRDPRDVSVSYYYQKTRREGLGPLPIEEFIMSDIYGIERQSKFVLKLLEFFEEHPGPKLLLHYEQAVAHPRETLASLIEFIFSSVDDEALDYAVDKSTFTNMRQKEMKVVQAGPGTIEHGRLGVANWDGDPNALKVRKGRVGGFAVELSAETQAIVTKLPMTERLLARLSELGGGA